MIQVLFYKLYSYNPLICKRTSSLFIVLGRKYSQCNRFGPNSSNGIHSFCCILASIFHSHCRQAESRRRRFIAGSRSDVVWHNNLTVMIPLIAYTDTFGLNQETNASTFGYCDTSRVFRERRRGSNGIGSTQINHLARVFGCDFFLFFSVYLCFNMGVYVTVFADAECHAIAAV